MTLRSIRFLSILLSALAMAMELAHVLELPQKMTYDAQMYAAVNGSLYRFFAIAGAPLQIGSILAALVLAFYDRNHWPSFRWSAVGAVALIAAFAIWFMVVEPVNREVAEARFADPSRVIALWVDLRNKWEYGHAAGFLVQLIGFCAILRSVLVETPIQRTRPERQKSPTRDPSLKVGDEVTSL